MVSAGSTISAGAVAGYKGKMGGPVEMEIDKLVRLAILVFFLS
jgi:hypothetical protein